MTAPTHGNARRIALFFSAAVLIGAYWALSATVGDTLFLTSLARNGHAVGRWLPWLYVFVAAGAVAGTWTFSAAQRRLPRRALVVVTPLALGALLGALRLLLALDHFWVRIAIAVSGEVAALISVMLFFSVAGDHFSSRDAKRLYGVVWGGLPVGVLAGGALVVPLIAAIGVANLMWIAIALLGGTALIYGAAEHRAPSSRAVAPDVAHQASLSSLVAEPYARRLTMMSFLTAILFVCADLPLKWLLSGRPPDEIARFFGVFYASVGFTEIVIQFALARLIMTGLGATNTLFVFPVLVGSACAALIASPTIAIAAAASWIRAVTSETIEAQGRELHWLALPERIRHRLQPWVSGAVVPAGQGAAGLILAAIAAIATTSWQVRAAPLVGVGVAVVALLTVARLRPLYLHTLAEAVRYHLLDEGALGRLLRAPANLRQTRSLLASSDADVRALTMELMERMEADDAPAPRDLAIRTQRTLDAMELTRRARAEADAAVAPFLDDHLETRWRELLHLWALEGRASPDVLDGVRVNLWTASHSEALDLLDAHLDRATAARVLPLATRAESFGPGLSPTMRAELAAAGGWLAQVASHGPGGADDRAFARIAELKTLELFADVPRDLLAPVAALADDVLLLQGTELFAEGSAADALYLIVDGQTGLGAGGIPVGTLGRGESLGELSLLDGAVRSATAVALTACRLTRIPAEPFRALLATEATLVIALLRTLCGRLRATQHADTGAWDGAAAWEGEAGRDGVAAADVVEHVDAGNGDAESVTALVRRAGFLHRVPLFRGVSAGYVGEVARIARAMPVFAGETLFAAGTRGDALYVIESGRVAIRIDGRRIGVLGRGDFVGEMALIDGAPRSATAVVEEGGLVLRINAASFTNLVATTPAIGVELLRELAARLRRATLATRRE